MDFTLFIKIELIDLLVSYDMGRSSSRKDKMGEEKRNTIEKGWNGNGGWVRVDKRERGGKNQKLTDSEDNILLFNFITAYI